MGASPAATRRLESERVGDGVYLFLSPTGAANRYSTVVEYHTKIRPNDIYAFDVSQVYLCRTPYSSFDDRASICKNNFCCVLPESREQNYRCRD
jgi:hypothetical protein